MHRATIAIVGFCLSLLLLAPQAYAAKRVAFVVGIDKYDNLESRLQLKKAVNDARAVGEALKSLGYEVVKADNVARLDFLRQWQIFLNRLEPGDEASVFFAGHGVEIGGQNFLLPRDVPRVASGEEEVLKASGVSLSGLLDQVRERKPQVTLYILDACRDNPFVDARGRSIGGTRGLARVEPPSGSFIMFSAGAGESALDRLSDSDPDPNSVYTRALLPRLKRPGKITDIARDVRRDVRELASRIAHVQTPAYYDEVVGDFCPAGCEAEIAKAEQPPAPAASLARPLNAAAPANAPAQSTPPPAAQPAEPNPPVISAPAGSGTPPSGDKAGKAQSAGTLAALAPDKTEAAPSANPVEAIRTIRVPDVIWSVVFSPDGTSLATGDHDHKIRVWDVATGQLSKTLEGHADDVMSVAFSSDGALIASASEDQNVGLWDARTGTLKQMLKGHTKRAMTVAFTPDNTRLASGGDDQIVRLWDVSDGKLLRTFEGQAYSASTVAFSPDGQRLASAGWNDGVTLWDVASGKKLSSFSNFPHYVDELAFSPDWRKAATATSKLVKLWDVASGELLHTMNHGAENDNVDDLSFSPDGALVASVDDKKLNIWDVASGTLRFSVKGPSWAVTSVVFSPDGSMLAVAGGELELFDIRDAATAAR